MNFIALDLETTGLNPKKDHVIEVAIVLFNEEGEVLEKWSSLVKPSISIPSFTTRLTGIDNIMVKDAPTLEELRAIILEKIGDHPILGHFIFFDVNFLKEKGFPLTNIELDTCQLIQVLLANEPSYSLEVLTRKLAIRQDDAHRALDDVLANIELYRHMKNHVQALSADEKAQIRPLLEKSTWSWAALVLPWLDVTEGERMPNTERTWAVTSQANTDLKALAPQPPFLMQEATHNLKDLLDYALALEQPSLLIVPNLRLCPEHPDAFILKNPNDYISPKRLELFLADEQLSDVKTMLGLKLVLELAQNQSGEKSQFRLFKDEVPAWFEICGQEDDPGSIYEAKLKEALEKKVLVLSHSHFLSSLVKKTVRLPAREVTVVASVESWLSQIENSWHLRISESRFLHSLLQVRTHNPQHAENLDALAGQISIFFGFMGMALRTYGESNEDHHMWKVETHDRNSMEWNKIVKSIQSIENSAIALSNELEDTASKQEMLESIVQVREILETEGPVLWLTQSMDDQIILHAFPENTRTIFEEKLWKIKTQWHLFAHHLDLDDEGKFVKDELALPTEIPLSFHGSMKGWPLYSTNEKIPSPNDPQNVAKVSQWIGEHIGEWKGNAFLLLSAKHTAEQFFYSLVRSTKAANYELFVQNFGGGMGKIMKMAEKNPDHNLFVGNADFLQFLINEGVDLQTLIVQRLPFSHPKDPITQARSQGRDDTYRDFALPFMKLQNRLLLDSFLGDAWQGKAIHMLDSRG